MTSRLPSLLSLVAFLSVVTAEGASKSARFDELLVHYQKAGFLNGVVLIAEHGKVIYAKGFDEADLKAHVPNTPQTKFDIASLTKQFTAALVLQQVAEGRMRLEDKVSDYLPWYRKDTGSRNFPSPLKVIAIIAMRAAPARSIVTSATATRTLPP